MSVSMLWLIPMAGLALVGLASMVRAALKVRARLRAARPLPMPVRKHPAHRTPQASQGTPLLDEPPAECPTCQTPALMVVRGEFTPDGEKWSLQAVEHFKCENGHTFMGPNQRAMLDRRLVARRKLSVVSDDLDAQALKAKVTELDKVIKGEG